jgi:YD repeat-containing protein
MTTLSKAMVAMLLASTSTAALASETTTYTYDAKGRLVKVVRSGSVNNGTTTDYSHDKADNRSRIRVEGSPNQAPPQ